MHRTGTLMALAATVLIAGCGGTMQGVVRGEGTPVQFQYEQGLDRDFYTAVVDGEQFSGQAVNAGASSETGTVFAGGDIGTVFVSTTTGEFIAVLLGDRGSSMHRDGRVIDVTW